jgi:hypothetical protein
MDKPVAKDDMNKVQPQAQHSRKQSDLVYAEQEISKQVAPDLPAPVATITSRLRAAVEKLKGKSDTPCSPCLASRE